MKELSRAVKELRQKTGWTQEDFAHHVGVSLSTAQRWEKRGGNPTKLARRQLQKLFQKVGILN